MVDKKTSDDLTLILKFKKSSSSRNFIFLIALFILRRIRSILILNSKRSHLKKENEINNQIIEGELKGENENKISFYGYIYIYIIDRLWK